jgi:hypothetical protein
VKRYGIQVWVHPGVQVDEAYTDDRGEAFRLRDALRAKWVATGHRYPSAVVLDNDGRLISEDDEAPS